MAGKLPREKKTCFQAKRTQPPKAVQLKQQKSAFFSSENSSVGLVTAPISVKMEPSMGASLELLGTREMLVARVSIMQRQCVYKQFLTGK